MKRLGRRWFDFGGAPHAERDAGSLVAWCGRSLAAAAPAPHPATWRDACVNCSREVRRAAAVAELQEAS